MNKLIILTPSIIRGDFHSKSIGKFYDLFFRYIENKYEIYHIINIDEPENLKKYFNKYETMGIYNNIIPNKVNKIFITEPNPGFLQAWKKIVKKIEDMGLMNVDYLYYWLEDDWEPKAQYDLTKFFDLGNYPNTAITFTDRAPLGSFRGGPIMSGSYFSNIFNIRKYMNDTCDPEKQMQRWLRGSCQKNGNSLIHRFDIPNENISNSSIHIIIVCDESNISLGDLNKHHYCSGFDKSIKFSYHLITYDSEHNLKYSELDSFDNYNLDRVDKDKLNQIFSNNHIKYLIIKPAIMFDIGREFNVKYGLQKWMKIDDNTSYANIKFYNAYLGNWKSISNDEIRLSPRYTMNKGFFSALAYIHQCLPYLEKNYFDKNINLHIQYYSHNYGNYPNFQVIGDLIQLNYYPSINMTNTQYDELNCLSQLCKKICGDQTGKKTEGEDSSQFFSYADNFELANKYFFKYFKFDEKITNKVYKFVDIFINKKVLGLHYRGTDKNKVNWIAHISINEFIKIIDYHLSKNNYDIIFISTDDNNFISLMKEKYANDYVIEYYDELKNISGENNSIHLNRLKIIENKIKEIKKNINDRDKMIVLENNLKEETQLNNLQLENVIVNSFILSKCDCVIKTHSQISAYSKIFNPNLEIYRVNGCVHKYWPDSHIPLYDYANVENDEIKNLLKLKLSNECDVIKKM